MLHLEVSTHPVTQAALVRCSGRIVFHEEAKQLADAVRPLIESCETVALDLSEVRDIDSCGLGILISLHLYAREKNRCLTLLNPRDFVSSLFELTRLSGELNIRRGQDAAASCAA